MNANVTDNTALEIRRTFRVPPERVYEAWTDPEESKLWSKTEGSEIVKVEGELRTGGTYRLHFKVANGEIWVAGGEYLEVTPPSKLVYTWAWEDDPQWENTHSIVTLEFLAHEGGTELRLRHERFPNAETQGNHSKGWNSMLNELEKFLANS